MMSKRISKLLFLCFVVFSLTVFVAGNVFSEGQAEQKSQVEIERLELPLSGTAGNELEIFSWWAGWEAPALNALIDLYERKNQGVEVVNAAVAGGSGINAKAVLKTRILGGDPPDTFQVHVGQELIGTWVDAGRMVDLTALYEQMGWMDGAFPETLLDLLSTDQGIWSVPLSLHRSNMMWYIPDNLEEWGVTPPTSWSEFFNTTAPALEDQGIIPLSVGITWTMSHLWESVALGVLGPDDWDALWAGELKWTNPKVINVWKTFDRVLQFVPENAPSLSGQDATNLVSDGRAAFQINGDWVAGLLEVTQNLEPGTEFGWAAAPDTDGVFMMISDSFGLTKGAPNPINTVEFLKLAGSKEGSDTFNPKKGSISPRLDSDISKYGAYQKWATDEWRNSSIVGSLVHGVVAPEGFMNDFATVMETFYGTRNAEQASRACQALADQAGIGQ